MSLLFITTSSKLSSVKIITSLSVNGFFFSLLLLDDWLLPDCDEAFPESRAFVISLIFSNAKFTIPSAFLAPL